MKFMRHAGDFSERNRSWTGIRILDLWISNLALYQLSHPGTIDGISLNLSLDKLFCDTFCHLLTGKITSLFISSLCCFDQWGKM